MFITKSYRYIKGGIEYVSGTISEDATLIEIMDILNADEGLELQRISDKENVGSSIWLKDGDSQDNYWEIEVEQDI